MTDEELAQLRKDVDWILNVLSPRYGSADPGPPAATADGLLARVQELEATVEQLRDRLAKVSGSRSVPLK